MLYLYKNPVKCMLMFEYTLFCQDNAGNTHYDVKNLNYMHMYYYACSIVKLLDLFHEALASEFQNILKKYVLLIDNSH